MDNVNASRKQRRRPGTRRLVQLYSALLYNAHLKGFIDGEIYVGKAKTVCVPGFNCYSCPGAVGACPLGAVQNALASSGRQAGWYVLGILSLFGVVFGRTICGWLCPLGLIQELLHKIPTPKIGKSRVTRTLSWLKYLLLAIFVVALPLWYGLKQDLPLPAFCKYICPAGTLEGAIGLLSNPANADKFAMLGLLFTRKLLIMLAVHSPMTGEVEPEDFVRARGWDRWLLPFALDDEDRETIFTIVNGSTALPQTIVLNRRGEVIFNRVGSVTPEMLEALYRQANAGTPAGSSVGASAPAEKSAEPYRVLVTDEAGIPVPGVTILFCSDTECIQGKTGTDGIAAFDREAGDYTVHIQKVPDGYAGDNTEYPAPDEPGPMTVVIKKSATDAA